MLRNHCRSRSRRRLVVAVIAALGVLVAIGVASAATRKESAKSPLILFEIFEANSPVQGKGYSALNGGAGAAVLAINKAGGINGHKVVLNGCDDNSDINRAVACARQAVSLHAWAVVASSSLYTAAMDPILQAAGIPYVGGWLNSATDATSSEHYPVASVGALLFDGVAYALRYAGAKKISVLAVDVAASRALAQSTAAAIGRSGAEYTGTVTVPLSVTDYSPYLQALRNQGATGVIVTARTIDGLGVVAAATQLGITNIKWGIQVGGISVDQLKSMGVQLKNVVGCGYWPPPTNPGKNPGLLRFVKEVKAAQKAHIAYASLKAPLTINGWVDPWALALLAKQHPSAANSSQDLVKALDAQKKPISIFGLADWTPGLAGPPGFTRISNGSMYYTKANKDGVWYATSKRVDILKVLGLK